MSWGLIFLSLWLVPAAVGFAALVWVHVPWREATGVLLAAVSTLFLCLLWPVLALLLALVIWKPLLADPEDDE
jgi:hypothetical protein